MAGHSKWKNIQHRKGAQDAKRGKIFTKVLKEITVAVKAGGPEPENNPRLRTAIQNAKGASVPKDTIERAVKKASGGDSENYIEVTFEGYGPEGVAIFVECATDNNTRTVANVRSYFNKHGGSLGKDGSLQFLFNRKAIFEINAEGIDAEEFELEIMDADPEDIEFEGDSITVTCELEQFGVVQKKLAEMGIEPKESGLRRIPTVMKNISPDKITTLMKLIDKLEEDDDVQNVYHNIEFTEELAAALG